MTGETPPVRRHRGRLRWILGAAALIVVAGSTGTALMLTGSPASSPPVKPAAAPHSTPPAHTTTPTQSHTPAASHTATAAKRTARPSPSATHAQPPPAPAPTQAQPATSAPQQDCYAPPHPTCTVPPPPSSLLNSPYTTSPTARP